MDKNPDPQDGVQKFQNCFGIQDISSRYDIDMKYEM